MCVAVKQTDYDCSYIRDCDEAACVLGVNNQHPSEVMGNREGGREGDPCTQRGPASVWGAGQWDTASWNLAFNEAPWLMGSREVNSNAPKLYLIFIHMNAPG